MSELVKHSAFTISRPGEYRNSPATTVLRIYRPTDEFAVNEILRRSGPINEFEFIARLYSDTRDDGSQMREFVPGTLDPSRVVGMPFFLEHSYPEGVKLPTGAQLNKRLYDMPTAKSVPIGRVVSAYGDIIPGDVLIRVKLDVNGLSNAERSELRSMLLTRMKDISPGYLIVDSEAIKRSNSNSKTIPRVDGTSALFVEASLVQKGDIPGSQVLLVRASNEDPVVSKIMMYETPHETEDVRLFCNSQNQGVIHLERHSDDMQTDQAQPPQTGIGGSSTPTTGSIPSTSIAATPSQAVPSTTATSSSGGTPQQQQQQQQQQQSRSVNAAQTQQPVLTSSSSGGIGSTTQRREQDDHSMMVDAPINSNSNAASTTSSATAAAASSNNPQQNQSNPIRGMMQSQPGSMTQEQQQFMLQEIQKVMNSAMSKFAPQQPMQQQNQPQQQQQQQPPQQQQQQQQQQQAPPQHQQQQQAYEDPNVSELKRQIRALESRFTFMEPASTVADSFNMPKEVAMSMLSSMAPEHAKALIDSANAIYASKTRLETLGQSLQSQQQQGGGGGAGITSNAPPTTTTTASSGGGAGATTTTTAPSSQTPSSAAGNMATLQRAAGNSFVQKRPIGQDSQEFNQPSEKIPRNTYSADFDPHRGQQQQQQQQQQPLSPIDAFMKKVDELARSGKYPGNLYSYPEMQTSLNRSHVNT